MYASLNTRILCWTSAFLSLSLIVSGCSTFTGGSQLHKSAKGSVYLTEVDDWSFEAGHPAMIDPVTMLTVVKGLVASDGTRTSAITPVSGSKPMSVFSDEDAEFLAPLLAQGLSKARPEQIIGFTVSPSAGSGTEPTAGTLYVHQGFLYITIAPSPTRKVTSFLPSSAVRIEKAPSYAAMGTTGAMSLVIDYQAFAKAALPSPRPVVSASQSTSPSMAPVAPIAKPAVNQETPASALTRSTNGPTSNDGSTSLGMSNDELLNKKLDELRQAREANKMRESEILMLRKEVEWMKRELRERTAELKAIKASKTSARPSPKKKRAQAQPTR